MSMKKLPDFKPEEEELAFWETKTRRSFTWGLRRT
jgi:hypothetical protein